MAVDIQKKLSNTTKTDFERYLNTLPIPEEEFEHGNRRFHKKKSVYGTFLRQYDKDRFDAMYELWLATR